MTPLEMLGYVPCRNNGSKKIPPYAAMRVVGTKVVRDTPFLLVEKPNAYGSQYNVVINGPVSLGPSAKDGSADGLCHTAEGRAVYARFAAGSEGAPSIGDLCGPTDDEWGLTRYVGGFRAVEDGSKAKDGRLLVVRQPLLTLRGNAAGACSKNNDGTMTVKNAGGTTSYTVDFSNELGDILDLADMVVSWIDEAWWAIGAECEVT